MFIVRFSSFFNLSQNKWNTRVVDETNRNINILRYDKTKRQSDKRFWSLRSFKMGFCPDGKTEVSTFLKYFLMLGTFLHWVCMGTSIKYCVVFM